MFDKNLLDSSISEIDKKILITIVDKINLFFSKFGIDINYDNSANLFQNLKIVNDSDSKDFIVYYDDFNNTIKQNFEHPDFSVQRYEGEFIKSLLDIISKKYNFESNKYDNGLICCDTSFRYHGLFMNKMLKSYISTLISGYKKEENLKDFYFDSPIDCQTMPDRLIPDLVDLFGSGVLLDSFINGNGSELFYKIGTILGSEEEAIKFYDSIDEYDINRINNRQNYDKYIELIKQNNLKNNPIM